MCAKSVKRCTCWVVVGIQCKNSVFLCAAHCAPYQYRQCRWNSTLQMKYKLDFHVRQIGMYMVHIVHGAHCTWCTWSSTLKGKYCISSGFPLKLQISGHRAPGRAVYKLLHSANWSVAVQTLVSLISDHLGSVDVQMFKSHGISGSSGSCSSFRVMGAWETLLVHQNLCGASLWIAAPLQRHPTCGVPKSASSEWCFC